MAGLGPAAAFLAGWNEADDTEKDRRLEEMRVLAGTARDVTSARATASTTRREEELFPDLREGQSLRNVGADIANQRARVGLDVERQTAPFRVGQERIGLDQSFLDYRSGIITQDELINRIDRDKISRQRVEGITGETPGTLALLGQVAPGLQTRATVNEGLFGLGATNKALQFQFNNQVMQSKIASGLAPHQAQAEILTIVNQSNLLAAQAFAAIQKPYLTAIGKAGTNQQMKIEAKRKGISESVEQIGKIETNIAKIESQVTLQDAIDAGLDDVVITMLNPSVDDKTIATARLENYKTALISLLWHNYGTNYHALTRKPPASQLEAPALSSDTLLYMNQLNQMQNNILPSAPDPTQLPQVPGMTDIPGLMTLPGVGATPGGTPAGTPAPTDTGTTVTPQGWEGFDMNAILEAYGNLGQGENP